MLKPGTYLILTAILAALTLPLAAVAQQPVCEAQKAGGLINKGNAFLRARHFAEAIAQYQEALRCDPGCVVAKDNIAETYNNWGIWFFQQRKYKEAIEQFEKALAIKPNHANAKRNIGIVNQAAAAQGVDLETDAAEGGGANDTINTTADFDPLTGLPFNKGGAKKAPAAPHGSGGKMTAGKGGPLIGGTSSDEASPSGPALVGGSSIGSTATTHGASEEPPSGAALVIGGHVQTPKATSSSAGSESAPAGAVLLNARGSSAPTSSNDEFSSGGAGVKPYAAGVQNTGSSGRSGFSKLVEEGSGGINFVTPQLPSHSGTSSSVPPPAVTPTAVTPRAVSTSTAGGSVEDQLSSVEIKMYGQPQTNLTLMQRLDKMEKEVSGQARSGSILDRINFLKQNIGM